MFEKNDHNKSKNEDLKNKKEDFKKIRIDFVNCEVCNNNVYKGNITDVEIF